MLVEMGILSGKEGFSDLIWYSFDTDWIPPRLAELGYQPPFTRVDAHRSLQFDVA
jgi:hypothetical protein